MASNLRIKNDDLITTEQEQQNLDTIVEFVKDNSFYASPTITVVKDAETSQLGYVIDYYQHNNKTGGQGFTIITPGFLNSDIKNSVIECLPGSRSNGDGGNAASAPSNLTFGTYMKSEIYNGDFSSIPDNAILTMPPMSNHLSYDTTSDLLESLGGNLENLGFTGFSDSGGYSLIAAEEAIFNPKYDNVSVRTVGNDPYKYENFTQRLVNMSDEEKRILAERLEISTLIPDEESIINIGYGRGSKVPGKTEWPRYEYTTKNGGVAMQTMYKNFRDLSDSNIKNYIYRIHSQLDHSGYLTLNLGDFTEFDYLAGNSPLITQRDGYEKAYVSVIELFRLNETDNPKVDVYYKFDPDVLMELLLRDDMNDNEKSMYYTLKSRCDFFEYEDISKISVKYVEAENKISDVINFIADNSDMDNYSITDLEGNTKFNGLFKQSDAYNNTSTLLDYKIKTGLLAIGEQIKNVALTEKQLKELVEKNLGGEINMLFGDGSAESLASYIESQNTINYTILGVEGEFTLGNTGKISLEEIESLLNGPMLSNLQNQISDAKEMYMMIDDMLNDDGLYGDVFKGYESYLSVYSENLKGRETYGQRLYDVYNECLNKMRNFMTSKGLDHVDDTHYQELVTEIENNKKEIANQEIRAKIIKYRPVYKEATFLGRTISVFAGWEAYYPFKAEAEQIIEELTSLNTFMQKQVDIIEEYNALLNECSQKIQEVEYEVNMNYLESVTSILDPNLSAI